MSLVIARMTIDILQVPVCLHRNSISDISLIQTHRGLHCEDSYDSSVNGDATLCEWHRNEWRKDTAAFTLAILLSNVPENADGVETLLKTGDQKASASSPPISPSFPPCTTHSSPQVTALRFPPGGRGYAHIVQVPFPAAPHSASAIGRAPNPAHAHRGPAGARKRVLLPQ